MITQCAGDISASIRMSCTNKLVKGYTGRAIYIPYGKGFVFTQDGTNPNKITDITLPSGTGAAKPVAIDNVFITPFEGSASAGNADDGVAKIAKTIAIKMPDRGADFAVKVIDPLLHAPLGGVLVVEKNQNTIDGKYEVIGFENPVKADPTSYNRDENANNGAHSLNLVATEYSAEYTFVGGTDVETIADLVAEFETLYAAAY